MQNLLINIEQIALAHPVVKQVESGDIFNLNSMTEVKYPLVWIDLENIDLTSNEIEPQLRLYYIDRLLDDRSNELDIMYDAGIVLNAIFNLLAKYYDVEYPIVVQTFNQKFTDMTAGGFVTTKVTECINELGIHEEIEFDSNGLLPCEYVSCGGVPLDVIIAELQAGELDPEAIKTLYESNADTNAFTDADKTAVENIPTALSELTNDEGFITITDVPAQEQADWNQSDSGEVDFIKNKPTIPSALSELTNDENFITINDVPLQEQADWGQTDAGEVDFIKNKPSIPTLVSELTNDEGFITSASIPSDVSAFNNDALYITIGDVPAQIQSDWNQTDAGEVDFIKNKPTIPSALSELTNDEGFITSASIPTALSELTNDENFITLAEVPAQEQADWNQSDSGEVDFIKNKPSIPTLVSELTNDEGFITAGDVPSATAQVKIVTTDTYTLIDDDNGKVLEFSNVNSTTITLPTGLMDGWNANIVNTGGQILSLDATAPVTLRSIGNYNKIQNKYGGVYLYQNTTDTFTAIGDLS